MEGRGIEFTVQRGRVTQVAPGDLVESRERWVIVAGAEGAGAQRRADGDGEAAQRVAICGVTGVGILPGERELGIGIAERDHVNAVGLGQWRGKDRACPTQEERRREKGKRKGGGPGKIARVGVDAPGQRRNADPYGSENEAEQASGWGQEWEQRGGGLRAGANIAGRP